MKQWPALLALLVGCGGGDEGAASTADGDVDTSSTGSDTSSTDDAASDAGTDAAPEAGMSGAWLTVKGNRILLPDGKPFHGRGANLHDTRSCNACTSLDPDEPGLERWADELLDQWKANFVRFDLEAYAADDGYRKQW
ncbi:MAG: hypothetical protein ACXWP4_02120, partial [Polyangiales bacterium]